MHLRQSRTLVVVICVGWLSLTSGYDFDSSHYPSQDVITRDFCIIGGGSSGTYSAIRLHDVGKSIVVVERKDRLGGHTETYIDPGTQIPVDYGVMEFDNLDVVKNYFARLNVSYYLQTPSQDQGVTNLYIDFSTGTVLTNGYFLTDPTAALTAYAAQLAKYPYLADGFDLPSPVPADLLLPFGEFVTKYSLQDAVNIIGIYSEGIGDLLSHPTIYVMKLVGLDVVQDIETGFLFTSSHDNSEVYEKAYALIAEDVLLSSHVVAVDRSCDDGYVKVLVKTPGAVLKLIQAKKLIISIPLKVNNLVGFDLTVQERKLFAQFGNSAYYTGILLGTGVPPTDFVQNVGTNNSTYNLLVLPAMYGFLPTGVEGLTEFQYGSEYALPDERVKSDIIATLEKLRATGVVASNSTPSFAVFSSHTPFELKVSTKAIADGFYKELYALQGESHTFYTGAAFHTQNSALLWRFTEALLPTIVGSTT